MKYLLKIAIAAACGLALPSSGVAQDISIGTGAQGVRIGTPSQFSNYGSDSYGRRLNRYQNNYGYNGNGYHNDGYGQHNHPGHNGYHDRDYDYYGGNYGRVRDYRNHYRATPNRGYNNGYNNGYYYRPGFSIGGGSSRLYFGF